MIGRVRSLILYAGCSVIASSSLAVGLIENSNGKNFVSSSMDMQSENVLEKHVSNVFFEKDDECSESTPPSSSNTTGTTTGESTGSTTGSDTVNTTGGDTGPTGVTGLDTGVTGIDTVGGVDSLSGVPQFNFSDSCDRKRLRAKILPLFYLSIDYGSYIVNLTPQFRNVEPKKSIVKYDYRPLASEDSLIVGDYRDGFQKTIYGNIEVGIGAQVRFWFTNVTGALDWFWAYVSVLPTIGKESESVRYVSTLDKARSIGGRWSVPKEASDLDQWDPGDSIAYVGHGGIIFSAGAGLGPVGVGVSKLAKGTWETYVEKVGVDKAYVKMTSARLSSFSMFTNVALINLSLTHFGYADDGFSFLFDLSTDVGRKAYEDLIRGNVLASERFASDKPRNFVEKAPVVKVETFRSVATGKVASKSLMIPIIWDKKYSKGMVNSFTTSDMHVDRNTARVHYGIFTDSKDTRFWFKHKEKDFMFSGAKLSIENWDTKDRMESMFGTYSYAFRHEKSNGSRLRSGIQELVKKTGLDTLMVNIPDQDLGYTGIEFNVNFSEDNTMRLMAAAQRMGQDEFINLATGQIYDYFHERNDPYNYCLIDRGLCVHNVSTKTANAASKMYYALRSMYKYMNSDPKAFSAAYGVFGEGMAENLFTFKAAMRLAGPGVDVNYLIEGTYISMYYRQWIIDSKGAWVPAMRTAKYKGLPFNPATRHTRARGVVIGNNPSVTLPHNVTPVVF